MTDALLKTLTFIDYKGKEIHDKYDFAGTDYCICEAKLHCVGENLYQCKNVNHDEDWDEVFYQREREREYE